MKYDKNKKIKSIASAQYDNQIKNEISFKDIDLQYVAENDRLPFFKESNFVVWDVLINSNITGFTTETTTYKFGRLMLGHSVSQMQRFLRSYQNFAEDGLDHFFVQVFQKGTNTWLCGKTQFQVRPGDIIITDLSQPAEIESIDFDSLILVIPRQMLQKYLRFPERLHGQILK